MSENFSRVFLALALVGLSFAAPAVPGINFTAQTLSNGSWVSGASVPINLSINSSSPTSLAFNWNGTNFTLYNSSLVLMLGMDNNSAIGENSTNFVDTSLSSTNLSCSGTSCPTAVGAGKYGNAIVFDGSNNSIYTSSANLNFSAGQAHTIALWIYPRVVNKNILILGRDLGASARYTENLEIYGDKTISMGLRQTNIGNGMNLDSTGTITLNAWNYVVGVNDGSNLWIYINGVAAGGPTSLGAFASYPIASNDLSIGDMKYLGNSWFNGSIDEVRIWKRALNASEIYEQYASNLQKFNSTQWYLYVNQSKNATAGLDTGAYTYQAFVSDAGGSNQTEQRAVSIGSAMGACGLLSAPNTASNLTQNVSLSGSTCFNISAANVTLNCGGFSITGDNSSETYGVYSNAPNSTLQNCQISNFSAGIYLDSGASYSTVSANTVNSTGQGGLVLSGASFCTLRSNNLSVSSYAISLSAGANNNTLQYNNGSASRNYGLCMNLSSNNSVQNNTFSASNDNGASIYGPNASGNVLQYNNLTGGSTRAFSGYHSSNNVLRYNSLTVTTNNYAIYLENSTGYNITSNNLTSPAMAIYMVLACNNYNVSSNNLTSTGTSFFGGVLQSSTSNNGYIALNTLRSNSNSSNAPSAISLQQSNNTLAINNTLIINSSSVSAISVGSGSSNNTFYYNNLTAGVWVSDTGGPNYYNTTGAGNIYYFFNGTPSWSVFNISSSSGSVWANSSSTVPFNATTVGGNFSGSGNPQDWFPYTLTQVNVFGNGSSINASVSLTNLSATIGGDSQVNGSVQRGVRLVNITASGTSLVSFNYDFGTGMQLNFSALTIESGTNSSMPYASISGVDPDCVVGGKTLTLSNANPSYNKVCVLDAENATYSAISANCTAANEHLLTCDGTSQSGYTCTLSGTTLTITGLNHSAATQFASSSSGSSAAVSQGGGASYVLPTLSYSFNCSGGTLDVLAARPAPIAGLKILLRDASGSLLSSASTDSSGHAYLPVHQSGDYRVESEASGQYVSASITPAPISLALCPSSTPSPTPAVSSETKAIPLQPAPVAQPPAQVPDASGQSPAPNSSGPGSSSAKTHTGASAPPSASSPSASEPAVSQPDLPQVPAPAPYSDISGPICAGALIVLAISGLAALAYYLQGKGRRKL
ncbi:Concanavalin A-like lectin/glucanases superfamily protein [uncultured archaeon]|nr:Concanavalin A-like lectin/glucanases superfamily protein [uncultured archaeon]